MTLSFRTDRSGHTVQALIHSADPDQTAPRGAEQSDQFLHCFLFHLHVLTKYLQVWLLCLNFRLITAKFLASENLETLR